VLDSIDYEVCHLFISDVHMNLIIDLRSLPLLRYGLNILACVPYNQLRASDRAGDDSTFSECARDEAC
jgi:hypothetical protein